MGKLDWDDLRVFLALERKRSVRGAARETGLSHSTISRRLANLETATGSRVFTREQAGLALTEVGRSILQHAERVESEVLEMERVVFGRDAELTGPLRVTMPPIIAQSVVMPVLAQLRTEYPDVRLTVVTTDSFVNLNRREADIAIRFQSEPEPHLVGRRLPEFWSCTYASPDYLAENTVVGPSATAGWLGWGEGEARPGWVLRSEFPDCSVVADFGDPLSQAEAAAAGLGMAMLPCILGDAHAGLVRVPGATACEPRTGWVLTHADLRNNPRVRAAMTLLAESFAKLRSVAAGELADGPE
ncbi:MAG: LysR family transcriptional regulator [Nannocystales bacterium]